MQGTHMADLLIADTEKSFWGMFFHEVCRSRAEQRPLFSFTVSCIERECH